MKNLYIKKLALLLSPLFVLFISTSNAKNYYISASGNNSNSGLTPATAWQTIAKLNSSFSSFLPGDSILFKCGETFYGSIVAGKSGTSSSPIVISSYGAGAKPVISGLTTLTGWRNVTGNIWECTPGVALKSNVNILTINGTPYAVGRTPNNSYYVYQSATATQLTSSTLTGTPSYVGAEIVIKKNSFTGEKAKISAQSTSTVTYTPTNKLDNDVTSGAKGTANYGFFLQRFAASLDQFGEWYFNAATGKMQVYSTVDPSAYAIKASCVDTVILLGNKTDITISGLAVEGSGCFGIASVSGSNIIIKNCSFNNNTKAVYCWNSTNAIVDNNTINNSFAGAITVSNKQSKQITISNNLITNTGQLIGMGLFWTDNNLKGIIARADSTATSDRFVKITGNTIKNCGYSGIQFQGSNVTVKRNIIDTFCNVLDDGGGIYTFTSNASLNTINYINRVVDSNFIMNAIGAPSGANAITDVVGYYLDDQAAGVSGKHNTIWNIPGPGVQMNSPHDNIFTDNTIFNCNYFASLNKRHVAEVYKNVIKKNQFYQITNTQNYLLHVNEDISLPTPMTIAQSLQNIAYIDSNWVTNLKSSGFRYYSGNSGPTDFTFDAWKANYNHDHASILPPVAITTTNTRLETNPSYTPKVVSFTGQRKIDPKGKVYDNSATIPAWSSLILIDNGSVPATNTPPTANAGLNLSVTLPTNTATMNGRGDDTDGTISSYEWTKISGPSSGTIVTANAATTALNNLVQGVYQYQLTVTDNKGAAGKDTVQVTVNPALNKPPVANTGSDKTITLPTNSTTLAGTATDTDGSIGSYAWIKISGPASGTIVTANSATTVLNNLTAGVYQYQLTVTDNNGAIDKDTLQVTVNAAPNQAPVGNAGTDKTITLPTNSTTLAGSATDSDGTISSYAWITIAGPSSGTIATYNAATTALNNLVKGIYQYQLTVTDNNGAIDKDTLQVTVNAAPNQAPIANAGIDNVIGLPTNTATLTGSGKDVDGTIINFAWVKITGPKSGLIESAEAATTTVSNLTEGIYQYELTVTDNNGSTGKDTVQLIVNKKPNQAPTANAGTDDVITLPVNNKTLMGSGSDTDGTISSYAWAKIAGPSSGTIEMSNAAQTNVSELAEGVYEFELTITDNNGSIGADTVQLTVNAAPNQAPVANAGVDNVITLPSNTATLPGVGSDVDGTISSYSWVKIAGPSSGTIESADAAITVVKDLTEGVYQFELTVTDNNGSTGKDTVQLTVIAAANQAPVANAGADKRINLPTNTVTLIGSGAVAVGIINSYSWTKISGPASGVIATANASITSITNLEKGLYQFELTVTDSNGGIGKDTVLVTVNATPIKGPVAKAGADKLITLPVNTTTLSGTATDVGGTISSYAWARISGPVSGTIVTADSATTELTNLVLGVYKYRLTVVDNNGAISRDTVLVTVNQAPVAKAGADKLITLPVNTTTLSGTATDVGGTISSYAWARISGPVSGTIVTADSATTELTNLVLGVYKYRLTVVDNNGAISRDTVLVTVNQAPVAKAGADKLITLPVNTTTLSGTATDVGGTISSYAWARISGPVSGTIVTADSATTELTNLVLGVYKYRLTVVDNNGAISRDTVLVTVNQAPVAKAGADKLITLPVNTTTLSGTATDVGGTISSYAWARISGPVSGTIVTADSATTELTNLVLGVYKYRLTVVDNNGAISRDTVLVTVNQAPVAKAGADKLITLPVNTTTLSGTATDVGGTISSYAWARISGPVSGTIVTADSATTELTNLVLGVYKYRLTVVDNNGAISRDTVLVTVNQAPVAKAGADKLITLPVNTTTLSGTATDVGGTISSYAWARISGPVSGTIVTADSATTELTNLVLGVYKYRLTVVDNNGAISRDTVLVTVNQAPVAKAGADKLITLPVNTTTLSGTATDVGGTISSYAWARISGPVSGTIVTADSATTELTNLVLGVYKYRLTVVDNNGAVSRDTVLVTVNPPVTNARIAPESKDTVITLPINSTTLASKTTDEDSTISSNGLVKISGASKETVTSANETTTKVNNLDTGVNKNELTIKDENGIIGTDTVQVSVNPAAATDKVPVVNPGKAINNELKLYPNPVRDLVNLDITAKERGKLSVSITDMGGRLVKYSELVGLNKSNTVRLDLSALHNGYYIVTVRFDDGQMLSSKFIKYGGAN